MPVRDIAVKQISNGYLVSHYEVNYARTHKGDPTAKDILREDFYPTIEQAQAREIDLKKDEQFQFREELPPAPPEVISSTPAWREEVIHGVDMQNQLL